MQQRLGKNIKPNVHLYPVHVSDDLIKGGDRWTQIKNRIRLNKYLNEEQHNQLWDMLEELQGMFAWHKRELGQCSIGEHFIDTQGLPPCHMTPGQLSYWEEAEVNWQIQVLVDLGKMSKNASEYVCRVTLTMKKDGSQRFCGDYHPFSNKEGLFAHAPY